jgi:hypothetical protein
MNPSPQTSTPPNLELLRKAIREYQPESSRIPFGNLKPFHDSIVELRGKQASYAVIADLLKQNGVKTSRARVAEYGRIMLDGGKRRKRRKYARSAPTAMQAVPPAPKSAPQISPPNSLPLTAKPERGPHIAKVELLPPGETCD